MSDKTTLVHETEETFAELEHAIAGLTDEALERVWLGTWGVREILVHISGWHRAMVPALARVARGEPPYPAGTHDDFDAWNARFVAESAGVETGDVLDELAATHREFVAAVRAVPEADFAAGATARQIVEGVGPAHYREHAAQIREWRGGGPTP